MKRKPLFLTLAVLFAAGGLRFGLTTWRTQHPSVNADGANAAAPEPTMADDLKMSGGGPGPRPGPGRTLRPPDPNRRFLELTPEQRVELARKPNGIGG